MGSADLMPRNLDQRVEVLFPVGDPDLIRYLRGQVLEVYLRDDIKAWRMAPDGSYVRTPPEEDERFLDVQEWLLDQH